MQDIEAFQTLNDLPRKEALNSLISNSFDEIDNDKLTEMSTTLIKNFDADDVEMGKMKQIVEKTLDKYDCIKYSEFYKTLRDNCYKYGIAEDKIIAFWNDNYINKCK